jgi:DNA-binding CsgD family transcriptional regulator
MTRVSTSIDTRKSQSGTTLPSGVRAGAPRSVGAAAKAVVAARGRSERLTRVFDRSPVPLLMVDNERRYVEANRPARYAFRLTRDEIRRLRIEDLTPPGLKSVLEPTWTRLMQSGSMAGPWAVEGPDGGHLDVVYCALAEALPNMHVIAFAPAGWTEAELGLLDDDSEMNTALTPRELDVLQLAAQGLSGPQIAEELVVSATTVKTHFENIYAKFGVGDRAAAVASGMRFGLID